jgi:hypothetical protein
MSTTTLALWLFTVAIAFLAFVSCLLRDKVLSFPTSYLLYFAAAGLIQLLLVQEGSSLYEKIYWVFEVVNALFLGILALEIIWRLLPWQYGTFCSLGFSLILLISFRWNLNLGRNPFQQLGRSGSVCAAALLIFIFVTNVRWSREISLTTAGLVLLLAVEIACSTLKPGVLSNAMSQLGPNPGLILLGIAGQRRTRLVKTSSS